MVVGNNDELRQFYFCCSISATGGKKTALALTKLILMINSRFMINTSKISKVKQLFLQNTK
jgi:hypothetical protein